MANLQWDWLKGRHAIEPTTGRAKQDHGIRRCFLKGSAFDARYTVLCAIRSNIHWLLQAIAHGGIAGRLFAFMAWIPVAPRTLWTTLFVENSQAVFPLA
jgi:transposase, IS5 family